MEWNHACQPLLTDNPYTTLIYKAYAQKLIDFLILYKLCSNGIDGVEFN